MLLMDQSLDQGLSAGEAERLAALHAERRLYDFAFGRFQFEGLQQKFWQPFEVEYRLSKAGFALDRSEKCSIPGTKAHAGGSTLAGVSPELGLVLPGKVLMLRRWRIHQEPMYGGDRLHPPTRGDRSASGQGCTPKRRVPRATLENEPSMNVTEACGPALVPRRRGNGAMPSESRNMPEQEHSIKARSHELFVDQSPSVSGKTGQAVSRVLARNARRTDVCRDQGPPLVGGLGRRSIVPGRDLAGHQRHGPRQQPPTRHRRLSLLDCVRSSRPRQVEPPRSG